MYIVAGMVKDTFGAGPALKLSFNPLHVQKNSHLSSKTSFAAWTELHLSFDLKCMLLVADIRAFHDGECASARFPQHPMALQAVVLTSCHNSLGALLVIYLALRPPTRNKSFPTRLGVRSITATCISNYSYLNGHGELVK